MATLNADARKRIPTSQFAGPDRSYPVEDRGHAIAAKGRAKTALRTGRMSTSAYAKIVAKANRKLGKSGRRAK